MHDEHNKINSWDITAGSIEHVSKRKFYFMFLRLERYDLHVYKAVQNNMGNIHVVLQGI